MFLSKRELATAFVGTAGFFIGRAVVFQMVNPLSVAFLATFMGVGSGWSFYITAAFVLLGLATRLGDVFVLRYMLAAVMLCVGHFWAQRLLYPRLVLPRKRLLAQAVMTGICVLLAGLAVAYIVGGSGYLLAVAALESVLAMTLVLTIKRATVILTAQNRKNLLSGEDMIALAVVLGGVVAGASDIYVGNMSLRIFMCLYVLFIAAYKGGAAMGGAAGMLLGLMLHLAGFWDTSIAVVLSLAGMGGGFLKRFGRPQVMAGVLLVGAGALFLLASHYIQFMLIYAAVAAGLCFMLTPQGFHFNIASAVNPGMDSAAEYIEKIKEETAARLGSFASAFEKLASTFMGLSKPVKMALGKKDASQLIDDLALRACQNCPKHGACWEDGFYETYSHVFTLLGACGQKGTATAADLAPDFLKNCEQPEEFLHQLNMVFALYRQNLQWHNRIAESRELVSQQLQGVSGIMRGLASEIDISLRFHEGLEEEMISALLRQKIDVDSVLVLEDRAGRYQCTVNHTLCRNPRKKICTQEILPTLSAVLKRKMQVESEGCYHGMSKKGICSLRFVEDRRFRVHCGVARRAKNGRDDSGDSYSYLELKSGQCLLALSDGMGSGTRAKRESAATVGLLEDFLESGFEMELAVKMINSVLVLKSTEESFSTLDICAVDLYTGEGEFIKIGAWSSFLLRGGEVTVIRSSSLPIGMLKQVDLEVTGRRLHHDDIVLMVTDGVAEAAGAAADQEGWLASVLSTCPGQNPQEVADHVLKAAEERAGGLPKDDMTVLAARVWRK